ncbi:MAG TPA: cellulase family glycosylhydrolase [Candidatus Brocadiia bacterium]|nr:cellulase family glycosylhydrolase [Candidatus Brocadiia bacterium]
MSKLAFMALPSILLLSACASKQIHEQPRFFTANGTLLLDPDGRAVILNGVNTGNTGKVPPMIGWQTREDYLKLRSWGFNHVRMVFVWEGIEPQPGQYDEAYLQRLAERVAWCREAGLLVILDAHQDLYSRKYGADGAPAWACLDDGLPLGPTRTPWGLNYFHPPVMKAYDNFWLNAPGPGGIGVQDRFIAAWREVARRFKDETCVLGYDLLNEPFFGSDATAVMLSGVKAAAGILGVKEQMALLKLAQADDPVAELRKIARHFDDVGTVEKFLDAMGEGPVRDFEMRKLQPFYDRAVTAIREVDPNHIIFMEPVTGTGPGIWSGLRRPQNPATGRPHANIAFAPHYYEVSSEFGQEYQNNPARMRALLTRAATTAQRLQMPLWVGEWGAPSPACVSDELFWRHHLDSFDEILAGRSFWDWCPELDKRPYFHHIARPYFPAVAGTDISVKVSGNRISLRFTGSPQGGVTTTWIPSWLTPDFTATREDGTPLQAREASPGGLREFIIPPAAGTCAIAVSLYETEVQSAAR